LINQDGKRLPKSARKSGAGDTAGFLGAHDGRRAVFSRGDRAWGEVFCEPQCSF